MRQMSAPLAQEIAERAARRAKSDHLDDFPIARLRANADVIRADLHNIDQTMARQREYRLRDARAIGSRALDRMDQCRRRSAGCQSRIDFQRGVSLSQSHR